MMDDGDKTKDQLLKELVELRERVSHLEAIADEHQRTEQEIRKLSNLKEQLVAPLLTSEKFKIITEGVVNIFGADFARIWMIRDGDLCDEGCIHAKVTEGPHLCLNRSKCLHLMASSGRYTHIDGEHGRVPIGSFKIGRVASGDYKQFITNDVTNDPRVHDHVWARELGLVSFAGYRLLSREGKPVGVLALFSKKKITPDEEGLLEDLASSASNIIMAAMVQESLKKSEERFRAVAESALDGIVTTDVDGNIIFFNNSLKTIFGYEAGELSGKPLTILMPGRFKEKYLSELERFKSSGKHRLMGKTVSTTGLKKDGSEFPFEMSLSAWESGGTTYFTSILRDLSERKKMEEELLESLKEKEMLLKEIYHRTKNNLIVISSLLNVQSQHITDEKALNFFKKSQYRARSMALIHERLYQSRDLKRINFGDYIRKLSNELLEAYAINPENKKMDISADDIMLDINTAIPLGLILNELISNSLKYAFPNGREGEISIDFREVDDQFLLTVKDDGVGFPEDLNFRTAKTLGSKLINSLTNQIEGEIKLDRSKGTKFQIKFKEKEFD